MANSDSILSTPEAAVLGATPPACTGRSDPPLLRGLAIGLGAIAVLSLFQLILFPGLGESAPFLLYFWAVLLGAWYGGVRVGLLTTLVAALLGACFCISRGLSLHFLNAKKLTQIALFSGEGLVLTFVTARIQAERQRSRFVARTASAALDKLNAVLAAVDDGITVQDSDGRFLYANAAAARMSGFASPDELLHAPPSALVDRYEFFREDGSPFPPEEFPGRVLFRGGTPKEQLICIRLRGSSQEHWSVIRANPVHDEQGKVRFAVNVFCDVTEKRRQEEALRLTREWLSTALRTMGDAVITVARDGLIAFLNPVASELTGWTLADAVGQPLAAVFTPYDETTREPIANLIAPVLSEGVPLSRLSHTVLIRHDRTEAAIEYSAAPIRSAGGAIEGVVLIFRDVSVKRREELRREFLVRATEELNSSLDYQTTLATVARLAVPAIADWCAVDMLEAGGVKRLAVAHIDPAKIEFVTELERRYPPDPKAATGVPNILRTGKPEMIMDISPQLINEATVDEEHRRLIRQLALRSYLGVPIKRGDKAIGAITFVMAESNRLYGPADLALATALADRAAVAVENARLFGEVEQARAQIAAQRDRLYDLVMASPMAIALLRGPELAYELVNEPFEKIFGHRKLQGRTPAEIDPTGENLRVLWQVFATGVPFTASEKELHLDRDGSGCRSLGYFNYTIIPMRDETGKIDGVMSFTIEVTEQVLARRRVEEARRQAELANRSKDEFLAILGHELRNPLAPILTTLQLMRLRSGGALERERNIIERQVKHVVRLVDDLLDVSRITGGKVELAKEPLAIAEVVAKAIEMAGPLLEQRQHELTVAVAPELFVQGDPVRLAQVMANVLNNAAKYTEKGGRIEVRGEREGDCVMLAIRDNGMGIAPEMLPRVFDLFAQEPQALDRAQGGLGLGLAIVRSLVALHGGTATAQSEGLGKGSEFTIRLPALPVPELPRAVAGRPPQEKGSPAATTVLVVDDNVDALELLVEALSLLGYQTERAADAPEALIMAEKIRPAIALLDIGLPVMDGYELARRLRELPGLERIKLVAITGYGQKSDRQRSAAAGFDEHLVKPVTVDVVQAVIERLQSPPAA